ncbi:MAG TPA: IS1182 family transposase [Methyloceanibacter sp.]|jgi:transposase|nr:IS1182 family transposase [Methyloceanibacter sp.]
MRVQFRAIDRETPHLLPASIQDYIPEDHLARFIVEIVQQLDLHPIAVQYSGRGSDPYPPDMMVSLLFYGYATGVFFSRKLEYASHDSLAFRYICGNTHPDHSTIAPFRRRFAKELEDLFTEILLMAKTMGALKVGTISLDGSKVKANASKHKALSWEHACRLEEQLRREVLELMRLAEEAETTPVPNDLDIPSELKRREARLAAIWEAKAEIQRRAEEHREREQAIWEEKMAKREAREEETGRKAGGKPPEPPAPEAEPRPKDQVNLTDAESRIMPSKGGFEQAYNAQVGVDIETHLVVENHISQAANDFREVEPALANLEALPDELGVFEALLADTGYCSEGNVGRCREKGMEPSFAQARQKHNPPLEERFAPDPEPPSGPLTAMQEMRHRMRTKEGKALYARRKSTVETVFGIIKHVLGFRQFSLRGQELVAAEWSIVCSAWNLKRLHVLMG